MSEKKTYSNYQYPYPPEPSKWDQEERRFSQGLKHLFDQLFSRKLQNVLIADGAVNGRTIKAKSIALRHLVDGFGEQLDISENDAITGLEGALDVLEEAVDGVQSAVADAASAASAAQSTADSAVSAASTAQQTADSAVSTASAAQQTASNAASAASTAQQTASGAASAASAAQQTADGIPNTVYPIGCIVMMNAAPSFGTWAQIDIGLEDITAWQRTA